MPGHDPQHTSRSDAVGPAHLRVLFQRPSTSIEAMRPDGVMVGTARAESQPLVVDLSPNGRLLWSTAIGYSPAQFPAAWPSLATDAAGKAYVGSGDGRVRVVSATGQVLATVYAGGYRDGSTPSLLLGPMAG
ncbi:MAG: PQQ-binding-like beta-propeller repeat protein [Chloroflexota bacterium]|nr:PQQ-binding-like beta-propeller repeat protein [Chloroflexota bacterium]